MPIVRILCTTYEFIKSLLCLNFFSPCYFPIPQLFDMLRFEGGKAHAEVLERIIATVRSQLMVLQLSAISDHLAMSNNLNRSALSLSRVMEPAHQPTEK
jgi:hypothetical protein